MSNKIENVLIVGAGMAGLTLAIALRRYGIQPDIVEKLPNLQKKGAGIYLLGNAMRALESLNLAHKIQLHGEPIYTQSIMNQQGSELAVIDTNNVWDGCGPCFGIRRSSLQDILLEALGDQHIFFGRTVVEIKQQQAATNVTFGDGIEKSYDLVVGADGLHSSTRSMLFEDSLPRFCGQVAWRFLVPCPSSIKGWTLFTGRDGVFLFVPTGGGTCYCYADVVVSKPFLDPIDGRLERLRTRFSNYAQPVTEALSSIRTSEQIHFGPIEEILQKPWGVGRTLLIGDAAHATSPNMASGAAMAFEDALVLANLIASEHDINQLIENFTALRLARVQWVHNQTLRRDRIRNLPTFVRDNMTRLFAKKYYMSNYTPLLETI